MEEVYISLKKNMDYAQLNRKELAGFIAKKLTAQKDILKSRFTQPNQINSCYIDDLLPPDITTAIYQVFPSPEEMAEHRSIRENKKVAAQMNLYNPLLEEIVYAFQDPEVISVVEEITGLNNLIPDEHLYAGGISLMAHGNFLNPHLDNSHDNDRENYRVLNLLFYVTVTQWLGKTWLFEDIDLNGVNDYQQIVIPFGE